MVDTPLAAAVAVSLTPQVGGRLTAGAVFVWLKAPTLEQELATLEAHLWVDWSTSGEYPHAKEFDDLADDLPPFWIPMFGGHTERVRMIENRTGLGNYVRR